MFLLITAPGLAASTMTFTCCAAHATAANKPATTAEYLMNFMLRSCEVIRSGRRAGADRDCAGGLPDAATAARLVNRANSVHIICRSCAGCRYRKRGHS